MYPKSELYAIRKGPKWPKSNAMLSAFKGDMVPHQITNSFHALSSTTMKLEYVAHQMAYYQKTLVPLRLGHCGATRFPIGPQTRASGGSIWASLQVHRPSFEAFGPLLWKPRGPEGGGMATFKAPPLPQYGSDRPRTDVYALTPGPRTTYSEFGPPRPLEPDFLQSCQPDQRV